ncbi:DEAD/DEAH box helicase family protein [Metamycoplasma buccale]|uniref:DEAD/DEAH box helicase family protein n=1 Tax=Metamycoplasma buccale TaxID=55602 RepID=UPI00398E5362
MELTQSQNKAVDELVQSYIESQNSNNKIIVDFQAPTGSGKTFIIANVINEIIKENKSGLNDKLVFVIATLSSADLPIQMEQNLIEYKRYINGLFSIERKESPSIVKIKNKDTTYNLDPEENKVIIFGSSSFGKGRIFTEQELFNGFLDQIEKQKYTLIYIRDEAHHGGNVDKSKIFKDFEFSNKKINLKFEEAKFEYKIQEVAKYIIKMTATPRGKNKLIYIDEQELNNDSTKLLKNKQIYNKGIGNLKENEIDDIKLLEQACITFKEIQKEYANNNEELKNIRPAMLIQVDNEPDKKKKPNEYEIFQDNINEIIKKLDQFDLKWVKYFSNEKIESISLINLDKNQKVNLKEISKNDANCDVILFKIGPATGWNIPRACMLVQLRNVSSKNLSIQTVGRIKRFPNPSYPKNMIPWSSISNNYYIYSNTIAQDTFRQTLVLKEKFKNEKFPYGIINEQKVKHLLDKEHYTKEILKTIDKKQIEEHFQEYVKFYNEQEIENNEKRLVGEEGKRIEGKVRVYSWIHNSIELEMFVEKTKQKNSFFLTNEIISSLNILYKKLFISDNQINLQMYWYILIKKYFEQFRQIYSTCMEKNIEDGNIYEIKKNITLPELNEILIHDLERAQKNSVALNEINKYAYENPKKENHFFDSRPEYNFITSVKNLLWNNQEIKMYSKNPVFHGLKLQYLDTHYEIKNSFPDFIFKIENKDKIHMIYIELKSLKKDYDPEKTKQLLTSYKKYIENNLENKERILFEDGKPAIYSFLICYENDGDFYFLGSSEVSGLNDKINKKYNTWEELLYNKNKFITEIGHLFEYFKK